MRKTQRKRAVWGVSVLLAAILSLSVAGLQKGSELWRKLDNFGMIVITDSNEMYISEDIEDIFEVSDDVEYTIHIIQK